MSRLYTGRLRHVAVQIGLDSLQEMVKKPGINEALRLTVVYAEAPARPPDQTVTLIAGHVERWQELGYLVPGRLVRRLDAFDPMRYDAIRRQIMQLGFDRLDDQNAVKLQGDVWLLERAAVGYHHDVVLLPGQASNIHLTLVERLRRFWPEAVQEWKRGG